MRWKYLLALVLFVVATRAQQVEVGALGGVGGFAADDVLARMYWVAGAEACFLCDKRFSVYAEYVHFGSTSRNQAARINTVDLISGGLRLQRPRGHIRPFLDLGVSGGQDHFESRWRSGTKSHDLVGGALGGGATIAVGERWYVRPAVRGHLLRGLDVGASLAVSMGYRFQPTRPPAASRAGGVLSWRV